MRMVQSPILPAGLIAVFLLSMPVAAHSATATFRASMDFTDSNPTPVRVDIQCNTGLPLDAFAMVADGAFVDFVITSFTAGTLNCNITEVVPDGYKASYNDGTPSTVNCSYTSVGDGAMHNCLITNLPSAAKFNVSKTFSDFNPTPVDVELDCNTGLPVSQNIFMSHGDNVVFVVDDFDSGELDCNIAETVPAGYGVSYNDGSFSAVNCSYEDLEHGDEVDCVIENYPVSGPVLEIQACNAALNCPLEVTDWVPPATLAPIASRHCEVGSLLGSGEYFYAAEAAIRLYSDISLRSDLPIPVAAAQACAKNVLSQYYYDVLNDGLVWAEEKDRLIERILGYNPEMAGLEFLWQLWVSSPVSVLLDDGQGNLIQIGADGLNTFVDADYRALVIPFGNQKKLVIFIDAQGKDYTLELEGVNPGPNGEFILDLLKFGASDKQRIPFSPTAIGHGSKATLDLAPPVNTLKLELDPDGNGSPDGSQNPVEVESVPADFLIRDGFEDL